MTGLTHRLRRRSAHLSALRDLEAACAESNRAYARWSANPTDDHYREYLAADARVSSARRQIGGLTAGPAARRPVAGQARR